MTTARDLLVVDVLNLFQVSYQEQSKEALMDLLGRFRVQAKNSLDSKQTTAREKLLEHLLIIWESEASANYAECVLRALDGYRMQVKQADPGKKVISEKSQKSFNKSKKSFSHPLAGGPKKRNRLRGECPKCRSLGVVLARAYSGDEYFSCIYCGFQTYKDTIELDVAMPLAAELLGRRFDEKDQLKR